MIDILVRKMNVMRVIDLSKTAWKRVTNSQAIQARLELIRNAREIVEARGEKRNCLIGCSPTVVLASSVQELLPSYVREQTGAHLFSGGEMVNFVSFTGVKRFLSIDALSFINDSTTREIVAANRRGGNYAFFPLALDQLIEAYRYKFVENRLNESYLLYFGEIGLFSLAEAVSVGAENLDVYQAEKDLLSYLLT